MKKHSVLYKYFITYTAIALAICMLASFLFFFLASGQYSDNIDASNATRFTASREALDGDFEECVLIARKIVTGDYGFSYNSSYKKMDTPLQIRDTLQNYITNNSNFSDIILIPDVSKTSEISYYSAMGTVDWNYFDKYYGFDKITHQWIAENVDDIVAPLLIQTVSSGTAEVNEYTINILLIPTELFITNGRFDAVMFVFNNTDIVRQLTGSFVDGTANAMIVSSDGELLMADPDIMKDPGKYMEAVPAGMKLYTDKSSMFDWTYSLFVDESVFGGYFGTTGFVVLLCISVLLIVLGIAVAFIAARHSYQPIKSLMNILPNEFHSEENEFSIMQRMFTEMNRKNEMLMENIEELKDKKLDPLAVLLTGDKSDSRVLADDLGLPADAVGYVLGIFEVDDYEKFRKFSVSDPAAVLCGCVRGSIKLPTFVEALPGKGFYVTVTALNSAEDAEREDLKTMIGEAQERIRNTFGVTVTCTLSRTFYNIADAAEIVYSVICATNYRVMYGYASIIDMELFDKQYVSIDAEFFNCFFEFYSHLKSGDYDSVKDNLMQMKETIQESFSPDVFRLAYINIVHCFAQYLGDDEIKYELTFIPKTVDSAFENILLLTDRFFEAQNKNARLKNEILKIVQSEYTNSDLSISTIADKLDISNSYLRKYFKDTMGITLFAYIDEMRISHAKRMLFETDMPIKDIAKASGYNDINNFNRKFKAKTGKTPTAYKVNKTDEIN